MSHLDVIGFGALNVDKLFKVNRIAAAEEESFIVDFKEACGGSAANTVVGLARLGCKVGFIGKVGKDKEGKMLLEDFRNECVDTKGITLATYGRSGSVMGFVDDEGERALYIDPGVNDEIQFKEIDIEYAFQTKFLHLTSFVSEESLKVQEDLVKTVPEGTKVSLDPGALYAQLGLDRIRTIVKKTSILMPNSGELSLLTGKSDYRAGADFLIRKGVKIVAVKLGREGCFVTDGKESHRIDAFRVKAVDTTGAGDAFCAGFIFGLVSGRTLCECGKLGNFVASRCVTKMGARAGLPRLEELKLPS